MMSIPKSRFTESVARENGLDRRGFQGWVFLPAMLFGAEDKWWGDSGRRTSPHEGIDLCLFGDASRNLFRLGAATRIPAMYDGVVVAVIDDFLGTSIVLEHRLPNHQDPFLTIYGHVYPSDTLHAGNVVNEAEIIGALADTGKSTVHIDPHLHISLARPSKGTSYDRITWQDLSNPELFAMTDPLDTIGGPYRVIERIKEDLAEPR